MNLKNINEEKCFKSSEIKLKFRDYSSQEEKKNSRRHLIWILHTYNLGNQFGLNFIQSKNIFTEKNKLINKKPPKRKFSRVLSKKQIGPVIFMGYILCNFS